MFADMSKPKLAAEIARQLRKFHEMEIPGSKDPQLWTDIFKFLDKGLNLLSAMIYAYNAKNLLVVKRIEPGC
jgi:hypothetical protein